MPITSSLDRNTGDVQLTVLLTATTPDMNVFVADRAFYVSAIYCVHSVAGGDSAAVVVEKCTGTTAPASGTEQHTAFDLTGAANTVQTATITASAADRTLAKGDRIAIETTGTLTGLVGVLTIVLSPTGRHQG